MAITVTLNGISYSIPESGEEAWGENLSIFLTAIPQGVLQKTGGAFTLSADLNFGGSYGVLSRYITSRTVNASTVGVLRLASTDSIGFRNTANDGNLLLAINGSDALTFNGAALQGAGSYITSLTGAVTGTGPGAATTTLSAGIVTDANVSASAAIVDTKLATISTTGKVSNSATSAALSAVANSIALRDVDGDITANEFFGALTGNVTGVSSGNLIPSNNLSDLVSKPTAFNNISPLTTLGDVLYASGVNTNARLAIGTAGQVLTVTAGVPAWATPTAAGVTSVALTVPSILSVSGSPITTSGTLAVTLASQLQNLVLASPNGTSGTPTFRALLASDIPTLAQAKITDLTSDLALKAPLASPTFTGTVTGTFSGNVIGDLTGNVTGNTSGTAGSLSATLVVGSGGTGRTTLTDHGVLVGAGTAALTQLSVGATGTVLIGATGADPVFSTAPVLGVTGGGSGSINLLGSTSGNIKLQIQAAAGTYNFNLPTTSGSAGQVLTSQGGVGTAMTWETPGSTSPLTTKGDLYGYSTTNARIPIGTDGYVLTADAASTPGLKWAAQSSTIAGVNPTIQRFTSGSGTYTTPAGVQYIRIRMVGGGGSGSGGGSTNPAGNNGGNTTFGSSFLTASGGLGPSNRNGASGGAASGGNIANIPGGYSGAGRTSAAGEYSCGGIGGGTPLGPCTPQNIAGTGSNPAGLANTGAGSAGGDINGVSQTGGAGGGGGGYVEHLLVNPSATYSYSVGAGGAAASAGTGGLASSAGANGSIEITEFYTALAVGTTTAVSAATVLAGPTSGGSALPTFRALSVSDLPTLRSEIRVEAGNGHGSTNTKIRRYSSTVINTGTDITYADSATLGATFTINTAGIYFVSVTDANSSGAVQLGISHNSNQLTTNIYSITAINRLAYCVPATNAPACTSAMKICSAGDVIRVHTDGSVNRTDIESWFNIVKVST